MAKKTQMNDCVRSKSGEFIAEEMRTGKYPRKQAIAIGLSRADRECRGNNHKSVLKDAAKLLKKLRGF